MRYCKLMPRHSPNNCEKKNRHFQSDVSPTSVTGWIEQTCVGAAIAGGCGIAGGMYYNLSTIYLIHMREE